MTAPPPGEQPNDLELYRIPDAMNLLKLSRSAINELLRTGRLRSVREGRTRRHHRPRSPRIHHPPGARKRGRVMLSHSDPDPYTWLTVPEILADLDVPLQDWQEWEATGQTPTGVIFPDGQIRISQLAYSRWLDSLPTDDGLPLDTPEQIRDTLRYALRLAGKRGMTRAELGELFGDYITATDLDAGVEALIKAGICLTGPGENCRAIHYRIWGPA